jgi:predicted NAD-dependent protein-ADP-ribosyltransferase YbiA (DUF1768 family)
MTALDRYLETRQESDRLALQAAYLAIPEHVRRYALGDMDARDWPLRVLCTAVGERTTYDEVVTASMRAEAYAYFAERERSVAEWRDSRPVDGPAQAEHPTVKLATIPGKWPTEPANEWLRNEYPVTITVGGVSYASAVHAYWSLATTDEAAHREIRNAKSPMIVESAVGKAPLRQGWPHLRTTAMHTVLRAKFEQHPELADILVATGDARIDYNLDSAYWSGGSAGRNWLGRLLELVRSEIVAERAGFQP